MFRKKSNLDSIQTFFCASQSMSILEWVNVHCWYLPSIESVQRNEYLWGLLCVEGTWWGAEKVWWERCPHVHAHMVDEMDRNVKWERLVTGKNL